MRRLSLGGNYSEGDPPNPQLQRFVGSSHHGSDHTYHHHRQGNGGYKRFLPFIRVVQGPKVQASLLITSTGREGREAWECQLALHLMLKPHGLYVRSSYEATNQQPFYEHKWHVVLEPPHLSLGHHIYCKASYQIRCPRPFALVLILLLQNTYTTTPPPFSSPHIVMSTLNLNLQIISQTTCSIG